MNMPDKLSDVDKIILEKIGGDLKKRILGHTDSQRPTDDEVTMVWLLSVINALGEKTEIP